MSFNEVIPIRAGYLVIPVVERIDDASASLSKATVRAVNGTDPGIARRIFVDDSPGPVCRAVVDNQPFDWSNGLRHDAFDSFLQVCFFIARGRNDYVFDVRQIHRMMERLESVLGSWLIRQGIVYLYMSHRRFRRAQY